MKGQTFLTIAAAVGALFAAPGKMMQSLGSQPNESTNIILQATGIILFSIAVITFHARKDAGSISLHAILIGSSVMHLVSIPIDRIAYQKGIFTQASGLIPGTSIHILFATGFMYYLFNLSIK